MLATLDKTLAIIDALEEQGPAGTVALADETDLPRSTVHHHLQKLAEYDLVVNQDGTYRLALRFFDVGERVRRDVELFEIARWEIDELAEKVEAPAGLFVAENDSAVLLYRGGESYGVPVTIRLGRHLSLHATAAGKALLSMLTDTEDGTWFEDREFPAYTQETVTDPRELLAEVRQTDQRGYAVSEEERWNGRFSVAVPIADSKAMYPAAVEVELATEEYHETDIERIVTDAKQTAEVIDIKSDYSR